MGSANVTGSITSITDPESARQQVSLLHNMFSDPRTPGTFLEDSFSEMKPTVFNPGSSAASETSVIQAKLNRRLGPEYVSQRPAPGGQKLTYVEGWKIIGLANEVFGYNGWCSTVTKIETDFIDMDPESRRYSIGVTALVKITLKDGTYHEDIGYGTGDNLKSKGAALDKVRSRATIFGRFMVVITCTGEKGGRDRRGEARPP